MQTVIGRAYHRAAIVALLASALAGCGGAPAAPPTAVPSPTATAEPTATLAQPTASPLPPDPAGFAWQFVGLPGQSLYAVAGTGQADAPVFVGGTAGLYRSTDKGATWVSLGHPTSATVEDIQASLANPQVIYAGGGAHCTGVSGGQYRSTDAGLTWTPLQSAPASLQLDSRDPALLYGMSCTGAVRSTDSGETWLPMPDPEVTAEGGVTGARIRVPANPIGPIYASWVKSDGSGRIRTTYDLGKNWGGVGTFFTGLTDLMVDDKRPENAWALSQAGVVRSSNGGQRWTTTVTGLDPAHYVKQGSQGPYQLAALAAQYTNSGDLDEMYVGTYATELNPAAGAFSSGDLGSVWGRFGGKLGGHDMRAIHVAREKSASGPDKVILYAATDNGVYKIYLGTAR